MMTRGLHIFTIADLVNLLVTNISEQRKRKRGKGVLVGEPGLECSNAGISAAKARLTKANLSSACWISLQ